MCESSLSISRRALSTFVSCLSGAEQELQLWRNRDRATSESRTTTFTYSSLGQLLTINGPRTDVTDVTTLTYYACTSGNWAIRPLVEIPNPDRLPGPGSRPMP
jgi:hypothetical protein